jgi:hypothetical protein
MQGTADFHHAIANTRLPEAVGVVDDAAALDAAVDVLNADAAASDAPIRSLLRACQGPAPRLPGRHDHLDLRECKRQKAEILEQLTARGQEVWGRLGNPLIVGATGIGVTQKENRERGVDQQHVFHRMVFFLAAIIARLLNRILGALDAPLGAIVAKRGEVGTGAGGSDRVGGPSRGTTIAVASASATPMRFASAVTDRVGASPSARSVACRTVKRT